MKDQKLNHIFETKVDDLTDNLKELFADKFYDDPRSPNDNVSDNPLPWGCPWYFSPKLLLRGNTIDDMVEDYINRFISHWNEEQ